MSSYHNGRVTVWHGDCRDVLAGFDENSFDSAVVDPPYHFASIVKRFGNGSPNETGSPILKRHSRGFMNTKWDGGQIAHEPDTWAAVLRVLKPGAHLVAFHAPKNWHRLACAIEDAGFEIRDNLLWLFGSGFPKSHNISVAIDKLNGVAPRSKAFNMKGRGDRAEELDGNGREFLPPYEAVTEEARKWTGFGTSLKPAYEPIILARKPLAGGKTIAANIAEYGTGSLNIDACRIEAPEGLTSGGAPSGSNNPCFMSKETDPRTERSNGHALGRWPANILLSWPEDEYALRRDVTAQQKQEVFRWLSENA